MPEPERLTLRRHVARRAQGRCEYGQSPAKDATHTFALEHIIPRSQDGETALENLALACRGFLARRGDGAPGTTVWWKGFQHLTDLTTMYCIMRPSPTKRKNVGKT